MCRRRSLLVARTSLLLVVLFNHCVALTASSERQQTPEAPDRVPDNLSSAPTSRPCSSCTPKTSPSPSSSTMFSSSTTSNSDDSTTPHSDALVQHYERQLLKHLGLPRRPTRQPGTVDVISDHMHSLYKRFSEDDEWEDFVWIAGDRRKELGRLTSVRTHRLSELPKSANISLRFDLSSLVSSKDERPIAGELRLLLNLTGSPGIHEVSVYDVMPRGRRSPPLIHRLHTRRLQSPSVGWRSFDISPALVRWSRRPRWRQTGEGQLMLHVKRPRRLRRAVEPSSNPTVAELRQRDAELFSYYQNSKKRERRRHRKRKRNRKKGRKRKRDRKRSRERRRRRKQRLYNNLRSDETNSFDGYSAGYWGDDSSSNARHEKRNALVSPDRGRACQLRSMYVDFGEIGWNEWIVAPRGYHAGLCYGSCDRPVLSTNFNTTNHAIIQSFVYSATEEVPPPCCVAVELSPKPMLLLDENRNVILKNYEEMIVNTCGCR